MKITTPNGTLAGDSIEAILEEYGRDCLSHADLSYADLSDANLRVADLSHANLHNADLSHANLSDANLRWADLSYAKLPEHTVTQTSILQD